MIKENDILTTKEMIEFFDVSNDKWKRKRNELLKHFSNYYEYEIQYRGNYKDYHILKEIAPYQPINNEKKSTKRDKVYENNIIEVIQKDNIQTAMNVSRIIKDNKEIKEFRHKDSTVYEYTRLNMRTMFGTKTGEHGTKGIISNKIWCRLIKDENRYEIMNKEEIESLYALFSSARKYIKDNELEIFSDYQNGLITKEEMYNQIGEYGYNCFLLARQEFKDKYGFYPIKVPVYTLSAYEEENND